MRSPRGGCAFGKGGLAAGGAVDDAADARAAAHFVDAGVAGEAAPHRLVAADFLHPLRIGDQRAAERDEIRLAALDRGARDRRIAEPADRDYRNADILFHLGGEIEKRRVRKTHRRQHDLRRRQRPVMAGGDVQRVRAGFRGPQRDLSALAKRHAAGKVILDRQPINHGDARNLLLHRAQNEQAEAGAVEQAAAEFVGAVVFKRRVKLRNQIAVRGVNFDAIESGLLGARALLPHRQRWFARCAPWSSPRA